MPYIPRPATTRNCAHCGQPFESRHLRRKYCSNSCNVLASYKRTGRRGDARPTKGDLENTLKAVMEMLHVKPAQTVPVLDELKGRMRNAAKRVQEQRAGAALGGTPPVDPLSEEGIRETDRKLEELRSKAPAKRPGRPRRG